MTEAEKNRILVARQATLDGEGQVALDNYLAVNKENDSIKEAAYWVYEALWRSNIDRGASTKDKWIAFLAASSTLPEAIEEIASSDLGTEDEKDLAIYAAICSFTPIAEYVTIADLASHKTKTEQIVLTYYKSGNIVEKYYGDNPERMKAAIKVWKAAIKLQRKFYAYPYEDNKAEDYAEKIKKFEPSYELPKKSGCISFG